MGNQAIIDDRIYSVVGINGFRHGNLTRSQAIEMAIKMQKLMDNAGWRGRMKVYYRDGSVVDWEEGK